MNQELKIVENSCPKDLLTDAQTLVVLTAPGKPPSSWVDVLRRSAFTSLNYQNHYLSLKCGFFSSDGKRPWILVEWGDTGGSALERRWLARKIVEILKSRSGPLELAFWLEPDFEAEQLVIIEDIQMSFMDPIYHKSSIKKCDVFLSVSSRMKDIDPHRELRQEYHLGFRRWVNENPDELTSLEIGRRLRAFSQNHQCQLTTLDEANLKSNRMNLLLAVGQASSCSPSRLHIVEHRRDNDARNPLLLIGKGVTFDTGGINVKHHDNFVNCMKNDMAGAALMANLFMALVRSGFDYPLVLAVPCCENLVAENAMKPGTILTARNGKTVIIEHTDAEGRLILADTISYCQEKFMPEKTLVAATLTTAVMRQFSGFFTGVHFADETFSHSLAKLAETWGEKFSLWDFFLPFHSGNYSNAADLTNMGRMPAATHGAAGSNVAAHFLRDFATRPLIHFDIFGSTWNWGGQYPGAHYGATGAPFNTLFSLLMDGGSQRLLNHQ